jgi:protein-S-isoprenylcysteine O-methyltransferase Ste14
MYLGFVITLLGLGMLLGTYSPLFIVPLFALILHTQFVLREERWMEEWMGDVYLEYKRKTRRWI